MELKTDEQIKKLNTFGVETQKRGTLPRSVPLRI